MCFPPSGHLIRGAYWSTLYTISSALPHPLIPSPYFIIFHSTYLHLMYMYLFMVYLLLFNFSQESELHKGRDLSVFTSSSLIPSMKEVPHKIITRARNGANDHFWIFFYFKANKYFRSRLSERGEKNPSIFYSSVFQGKIDIEIGGDRIPQNHRWGHAKKNW